MISCNGCVETELLRNRVGELEKQVLALSNNWRFNKDVEKATLINFPEDIQHLRDRLEKLEKEEKKS